MLNKDEFRLELSNLIASVIVVIILIALIPIISILPGVDKIIFSIGNFNLDLATLISLILVAAIIAGFIYMRTSIQTVVTYLFTKSNKEKYFTVKSLSENIINMIYVPIIYLILFIILKRVVNALPTLDWLLTLLTSIMIVLILVLLFPLYKSLRLYFEVSDKSIHKDLYQSKKIPKKEVNEIICPNCGSKNLVGSKFCVNCGFSLSEIKKEEIYKGGEEEKKSENLLKEEEIICPKCGYKNSPDSKFCINCGTQLIP